MSANMQSIIHDEGKHPVDNTLFMLCIYPTFHIRKFYSNSDPFVR